MLGNAIFRHFPDSIWALKTIKIKTILTIFYVYYNRSFPQNLNLWPLEKSEIIPVNLQMMIQKNTFNVLSSSSPFEKNVLSNVCLSFFGADAILERAEAWDLVL